MKDNIIKTIALTFLDLILKGNVKKAFELYTNSNFKHHNVFFKGNSLSLIKAMEENAEKNPNKIIAIKNVLQDNDLVAIHSHIQQNNSDLGAAVMHIFRFENNKIVELWDFGQAIPYKMVNENGMF